MTTEIYLKDKLLETVHVASPSLKTMTTIAQELGIQTNTLANNFQVSDQETHTLVTTGLRIRKTTNRSQDTKHELKKGESLSLFCGILVCRLD